MGDYVHLHTHTEYSMLDGALRVKDLAKAAVAQGAPAVAITDHGSMYGAMDFYETCKKEGVKPILGCEVYTTAIAHARKRTDRDPLQDREQHHLLLLAENEVGYRNLLQIVSLASLEGFYYKPRADRELLAKHNEGIIACSACIAGEVPSLLLRGDEERAKKLAGYMAEVFKGRYYLEIQDHGIPEQAKANEMILRLSKQLSIPVIATNDAHYLNREASQAHDILLCVQTGSAVDSPDRFKFPTQEFYVKTAEEMARVFPHNLDALQRTVEVAERCNVNLSFKQLMPEFPVPAGFTPDTWLEHLAEKGLAWRYPNADEAVRKQLAYELGVIKDKGFVTYFLIVHDFVNEARRRGILAQARGSAAGCLVTYCLGISSVDPIANDLMFERFLRVDGKKMPDIDVDFCDVHRGEILEYVAQKYGKDHVAQIATFGTMGAKAAIRDAGRALRVDRQVVDPIAKAIPNGYTLDKALAEIPEVAEAYATNQEIQTLIETAKGIEGLTRNVGTHAAGVVISAEPLTDHVPLMRVKDAPVPTTQYDFRWVEHIGLLKMDFLGLAYLSVVKKCFEYIKRDHGVELTLEGIPLDDAGTYSMLCNGEGVGVFQVESTGMRQLLRDLKPHCFADVVPIVALYRPGPLQSGMVQDFIERRHGRAEITYEHPMLEPVLKDTYGVLLYQEQVMKLSMVLADFTPIEAEVLMKAMGKKQQDVLDANRPKFVRAAVAKGIPEETCHRIYDLMANFGRYGFNKSHSAAYSLLMYQTAWLKHNYPAQYMSALLSVNSERLDKVATYVAEARRMGLEVLPPDVNESTVDFAVVQKEGKEAIRFSLGAIKGTNSRAIESIIEERANGRYTSIWDFCCRVKYLNSNTLAGLINVGAFDFTGHTRRALSEVASRAIEYGKKEKKNKGYGQGSLLGLLGDAVSEPPIPAVREYAKETLLAKEKDLLGLYLSEHPVSEYRSLLHRLDALNTLEVQECAAGTMVRMGGMIVKAKTWVTRKGETMKFLTVEDEFGAIDVIVFPKVLAEFGKHIRQDAVVVVEGTVSIKGDDDSEDDVANRQVDVLADNVRALKRLSDLTNKEAP